MAEQEFDRYFRAQQVAPQWLSVLRALSGVLSSQAASADLRAIMQGAGQRMAAQDAAFFAAATTLSALQEELNGHWLGIRWGWVELCENAAVIEITHHAAPLAEAFGEDALEWSCGLLEGFYEHIFHQLGAGKDLRVEAVDSRMHGQVLHFRFGG